MAVDKLPLLLARRRVAASPPLPLLLVAPALLALGAMLFPFLLSIYFSTTNLRLTAPNYRFIGLRNYILTVETKDFWLSLGKTLVFALVSVVVQVPLAIGLALLLNRETKFMRTLRIVMIIPFMLPPIIAGLMWKTMLAPHGIINYLLGIEGTPWLATPKLAFLAIFLIDLWINLPFITLIMLSGLHSLPKSPFEAAEIDGASPLKIVRYITVPLLKPFIHLAIIFRLIDALKIFDIVMATTRGGPATATKFIQVAIYDEVFKNRNIAIGLAQIMLVWLLTYLLSKRYVSFTLTAQAGQASGGKL